MSASPADAPVLAETGAARFQKLFRTTAFKLSLAYLAIFALCAFLALGYVAWNARACSTTRSSRRSMPRSTACPSSTMPAACAG